MTDDEFAPRERGLKLGYEWMRLRAYSDEHQRDHVLGGEIPSAIGAKVITIELRERLDASDAADADADFWNGFIDGARAQVGEAETGGNPN